MATVYHNKPRTRAATWVPRRVFYVLGYLRRQLTPNKPKAISNKRIQEAIRFGSEGEVSQIMRWLAGEDPTMGRWAYGCLNANMQQHRFITRERMPSGGYLITLLATPEPLGAATPAPPEIVQMSFLDDPSVIPPLRQQDAAHGGSFSEPHSKAPDQPRSERQNARSARDHEKEIHEDSDQKEELARSPLFERLLAEKGMSRALAQRIAQHPIGTLAEFEADLQLATTFARSPFFFTVARWRDGQRVEAPQEAEHVQSRPSTQPTRRHAAPGRRAERPGARGRVAGPSHVDPSVYAAILAEAVPLDLADDL